MQQARRSDYRGPRYDGPGVREEPSIGDLFSRLSAQTSTLVREEVALARVEMTQKATEAGKDAALVAVGGALAWAGFLTVVATLVLILAEFMEAWVAALIVAAALLIIGGIVLYAGVQKLREIDPKPQQTIDSIREDKEWLSRQMN